MGEKRGKILVVRGGAIGDFILTLPAVAAVRSTFAESHLEILGYPNVAELAKAGGLIDAFRSIEAGPLSRFFARNAKLDQDWVDYFESFNLIISYLYDPDEIFKTNVGRATTAQFIQAQHRPDERRDEHATQVFLKPLEKLAIFGANEKPQIQLSSGIELGGGQWIAVHPGSGSELKNWEMNRWFELLQWIEIETPYNVVLVGGEAEGRRLDHLAAALSRSRVQRAERLPLAELGALLKQCRLFLGHDSGITHLAAAVGCEVMAFWGPSRREIWKPLGERVRIIEAPGGELERLSVGTVMEELKKVLG